jgi:hypothetical protein
VTITALLSIIMLVAGVWSLLAPGSFARAVRARRDDSQSPGLIATQCETVQLNDDELGQSGLYLVCRQVVELQHNGLRQHALKGSRTPEGRGRLIAASTPLREKPSVGDDAPDRTP